MFRVNFSARVRYLSCKMFLIFFCLALVKNASTQEDLHPLYSIFSSSGTDKATTHIYDVYYERYLQEFRNLEGFRMMEIGANTGSSLLSWVKYFKSPEAIHSISYSNGDKLSKNILSIDHKRLVCDQDPLKCGVVEVMHGDQSDLRFLRSTVLRHGAGFGDLNPPEDFNSPVWRLAGYNLIIDDGSHVPYHTVLSFMALWPSIRPGGIYIIEDIETNYWDAKQPVKVYGYTLKRTGLGQPFHGTGGNAVEKFKLLADMLNRPAWGVCEHLKHFSVFGSHIDSSISSITFGYNHLMIRKKTYYESTRKPRSMSNNECRVNQRRTMTIARRWLKGMPRT